MIVITRPKEDAKALAAALRAQGHPILIHPLLAITHVKATALEEKLARKPQALLVTSRHAVSALASATPNRRIPMLAAGTATAAHATRLGFKAIAAGATAKALTEYVQTHCEKSSLLYIRGDHISTDIATALTQAGFSVESITLYKSTAAERLSRPLQKALQNHSVTAILFFSQRTAATYAKLVLKHHLQNTHRSITALCISETVAEKLAPLPFKKLRISAKPEWEAMLKIV